VWGYGFREFGMKIKGIMFEGLYVRLEVLDSGFRI
jgi:hypothetical protein